MNEAIKIPKVGRPFGTFKGKYPRRLGGRETVMFQTWRSMVRRCHSEKSHNFKDYGGRGIKVCERWRDKETGFDNFCDDMGQKPEGWTIGRKNNNGPYCPENCAWETWWEQAQNRRPGGPPKDPNSLRQKCIRAGLPYLQVYHRIHKLGWDEVKALATPLRRWRMGHEEMTANDLPALKID